MNPGKSPAFVFTVVMFVLYAALNPASLLFSRPHGDHAWAQCDRASVALNYFQFRYPISEPHTHNLMYNPSGIATGEFPLVPFIVAKLYGVLGFHEFIFRFVTLGFSLLGFFLVFLISKRYLKTALWQLGAPVLWLLSPNLIYYSTGFLPDNVALTFFIIGIYFLLRQEDISVGDLLLFSLFSAVAVLLKSSVLFLVVAVFVAFIVTAYRKKELKRALLWAGLFILPLAVCVGWILYARHLQQLHQSHVFKLGLLLPHNFADLQNALHEMVVNLPKMYPIPVLLILPVLFVIYVRNFDSADFLHVFTLAALGMWGLFFILLMRNAGHHGYYHVPFQFAVFALLVCCLRLFEQQKLKLSGNKNAGLAVFFLATLVLYVITQRQISRHVDFVNYDWEKAEAVLRMQGVMNTDKVFSAEDRSYNISLYLMNQPGWTCTSDVWDVYKKDALNACDYAVLTDTSYIHQPGLAVFFKSEVFAWEGLHLYQLQHQR